MNTSLFLLTLLEGSCRLHMKAAIRTSLGKKTVIDKLAELALTFYPWSVSILISE